VKTEYDPSVISYEQLLNAFWSGHYPEYMAISQQYRSAVFYVNDAQKKTAVKSMQEQEALSGHKLYTSIEMLREFYVAEDYHQKYYLRNTNGLRGEMYAIYPDGQDLMNSTVAARINGYAAGYGNLDTLESQIDQFGLSEDGKEILRQIASRGLIPGCPVNAQLQ